MNTSLRAKLSGAIGLLAIATVAGVAWSLTADRAQAGRWELEGRALLYGRLISKQLEPAIAFDDHQTAREVFTSLRLDSDVTTIVLFASDGRRIGVSGETPMTMPAPTLTPTVRVAADFVEAQAPVVSHEGPTGTVVVRLSTARLHAQQAAAYESSTIAAMVAMLAALALAWLIAGAFARRLHVIAAAAGRVASGDLSQPELSPGTPDEIGRLTVAFNAMLRTLNALVSKLRETAATEQERLTRLVMERTERLDLRNKELEESREQYRLIAESTSAIPWEYSIAAARFAYVGPQAVKLLGYPADAWLAPGFLASITVDEDRARALAERDAGIASGRDFELEYRVKPSTGGMVALRCVASPCEGILRGLFLDVTARKQLEGELAQAQKLESIWRLAAGVAHEINTPVQYVADNLHFIREGWADVARLIADYQTMRASVAAGTSTPEQAHALVEREEALDFPYLDEHMGKAGASAAEGLTRVAEIVRSMKAFAHPNAKDPVDYDLNEGIASALAISRSEYKLIADVETQLQQIPRLKAVPGEINQVLLNLIVNAAHAIEAAQRGRGTITVSTAIENDDVTLTIGDNGCGIADGIRDRIFDQFFTTKAVGKGTGQGLSISRAIIQRHAGRLTFDSRLGVGTTFVIRLPIEAIARPSADQGGQPGSTFGAP